MNKTSKQAMITILFAATVITTIVWLKNRNKKADDDYDWIMW